MSIRRAWILTCGFALGIAAISGCKSTGTAFNPPGGIGRGSKQQIVTWDEFASTPQPQAEYASLPLSAGSAVTDVSGTAANNLNFSFGMLTDAKGRVWVLSFPPGSPYQTAEIFTSLTSAPITLTFTGTSDFGGIAFDKSGNLWAVDYNQNELYEYTGPFTSSVSLSPAVAVALSSAIADPSGLAVDPSGNVYISNFGNDTAGTDAIAVYTAPVSATSTVAYWLNGPTRPSALILDAQGNLYAGSYHWTPGGGSCSSNCITSIVGIAKYDSNNLSSGATPNVVDNTGMAAVDSNPYEAGFAFDNSGNLYVADCGNAGAILVYPAVATSFGVSEAPSVVYQDTTLRSTKCAWGIAVVAASLKI